MSFDMESFWDNSRGVSRFATCIAPEIVDRTLRSTSSASKLTREMENAMTTTRPNTHMRFAEAATSASETPYWRTIVCVGSGLGATDALVGRPVR